MASLYRVFGLRISLGAAFLASACQYDSSADFDDSSLHSPDPDKGGSNNMGGSTAAAGESPSAGSSAAGAEPGTSGRGGAASGGAASGGGKAGMGAGGKAGTGAGGASSAGGKAQGGSVGAPHGGTAGGSTNPEPVTIETTDIDDANVTICMPALNFGGQESMTVDGDTCTYEALVGFPRLELPAGALVSDATLTLTCLNAGGAITVSYANEAWKELMVRWTTRPDIGEALDTITCEDEGGELNIDLTTAFAAWLSGEHDAHGIYLRTEDDDGTDFATSEADEATRPRLSVTYTLPTQ